MKTHLLINKFRNLAIDVLVLIISLVCFPELANSQGEPEDIFEKRSQWFFIPRSYPYDTIPTNALRNAFAQKDSLLNLSGYSLPAPYNWFSIGPTPFDPNNACFSFYNVSGRVNACKFDPTDATGQRFFIGGADGGVWKTTNGGVNWTPMSDFLPSLATGALAIDPVNPNIIYYGTGDETAYCFSYVYFGVGLFKSTDGGVSWNNGITITGFPDRIICSRIVIRPQHSNELLAALNVGLYRSSDAGLNWYPVIQGICTDAAFSGNGNMAYAVGPAVTPNGGVGYRISTDGGANFQLINNEFPPQVLSRVAVCRDHSEVVYAATITGNDVNDYKVWKSTNSGYNFGQPKFICNHGCQSYADNFMYVDPSDPNVSYVGILDLVKTTDGWTTFCDIGGYGNSNTCMGLGLCSSNGVHPDMHSFDINPLDPNKILVGSDGGVYLSTNRGSSWTNYTNENLTLAQIYRIASSPFTPGIVLGAFEDEGIGYKTATNKWLSSNGACAFDGTNVVYSPILTDRVIGSEGATNPNGMLFYSANSGADFIQSNFAAGVWIAPITFDPNLENVVYSATLEGSNIYIYKSTNYGATYSKIDAPLASQGTLPTQLAISNTNPDIRYFIASHYEYQQTSRFFKTTNGGQNWSLLFSGGQNGIPNRYFTHIEIDPSNANVLYLTLSGFNSSTPNQQGHVFKSYNGGQNWVNIDGPPGVGDGRIVPDIPVNDLVLRELQGNDRLVIIGTDAGVYCALDPDHLHCCGYWWYPLADGLPNSAVMDLDYLPNLEILRAATFGRSVWEVDLSSGTGTIYISGNHFLNSDANGINIKNDMVVQSGANLRIPYGCTVKMSSGKKIIIEDGGQIDVTSNDPVYFTSQSGTWGGIEIHNGGYGTIKNCVFSNTETPITIESQRSGGSPILIQACIFNNGSVTVSGRDSVTISQCTTNTASASTGTAINAIYCDNLVLSQNVINDSWAAGIMVSNSSPVILDNVINHEEETNSAAGISLDNCYSGTVNYNEIYNYNYGIYLYYSSPTMLENIAVNNTTSGSAPSALYANYLSSPRLKPSSGGLGTIWDAGINELKTNNQGSGICMYDMSIPNIDYGYNKIFGYDYHLSGGIGNGEQSEYYAKDNCWAPNYPPLREDISDATVIYDPYTCDPPGGGAESGDDPASVADPTTLELRRAGEELLPPPPIIINYGNGIYDTIRVTSQQYPLSADQLLFSQGLDAEIAGNYQVAINKYLQVVQNYQDSNSAISSMKKILYCKDRMHADTNAYIALRAYYQNLAQQNPNDTGFVQASKEMASKCLVRIGQCPNAITEYETVAQSSNDSLEVLCAELNIIETYLIIAQGGDSPGFTGKLQYLKPMSVLDGIKMINEKLHRIKSNKNIPPIPEVFSLSQNYPNPFNPYTKINYSIPKKSDVTLKVYDILGRLVKTLVNEFKEPGFYMVQFDGSALASGVYFYTIEAGDYKISKKMVLVK